MMIGDVLKTSEIRPWVECLLDKSLPLEGQGWLEVQDGIKNFVIDTLLNALHKSLGNQVPIAEAGAIPLLVEILCSTNPGNLVKLINCLTLLAEGNEANQAAIEKAGAVEMLTSYAGEGHSSVISTSAAQCLRILGKGDLIAAAFASDSSSVSSSHAVVGAFFGNSARLETGLEMTVLSRSPLSPGE